MDKEKRTEIINKFELHEGIIHSITVEGLNKTKDHVILREVELKQGDIFNAGILRDNLQEVYNLQLFQDIEVDFGLTEDREVDLIIKVEEHVLETTGKEIQVVDESAIITEGQTPFRNAETLAELTLTKAGAE